MRTYVEKPITVRAGGEAQVTKVPAYQSSGPEFKIQCHQKALN
jgi:hypothetical protein